jgi:predicted dehydrogenase
MAVLSRDKRAAAIADIKDSLVESAAKRYGCASYRSYQDLINSDKLDAIYVVTPNVYHNENLKYAPSTKLNIFCEKLMVIKPDDARDIMNTVNVVSKAGHNSRFSLVYKKLEEPLDLRRMRAYMIIIKMSLANHNARWPRGTQARRYPGAIYMTQHFTSLHILDLLRWLFGEVQEVTCKVQANVSSNMANDAWISLKQGPGL